jgi:hypothetical protein
MLSNRTFCRRSRPKPFRSHNDEPILFVDLHYLQQHSLKIQKRLRDLGKLENTWRFARPISLSRVIQMLVRHNAGKPQSVLTFSVMHE